MLQKNSRTCPVGHRYYKTSDCPACPICEKEKRPADGFLSMLSAPARRALENGGITSLQKLAEHSEKEVLKLHGMGPGSLPKLRSALAAIHLSFRND